MNCELAEAKLLDLMNSSEPPELELEQHLRQCPACAAQMAALRQTSAWLDEWRAPEPSPYFDTRLAARLREQTAAQERSGLLSWLQARWQPALAAVLAIALAIGIGLRGIHVGPTQEASGQYPMAAAPGTPVGDLQALDKNFDLYANFDMLYEGNDEQENP